MSIDFDTPGTDDDRPEWLTDTGGGEPEGDNGGGNRLFLIIAIGLIGLIVLGLVAVGGLLVIRNFQASQELAQITPTTPDQIVVDEVIPTATSSPTPLPPTPTETPTIVATNTRVVPGEGETGNGDQNGEGETGEAGAAATRTATSTPIPGAAPVGGAEEVPATGFGGFEAALVVIGLIGVLIVSRRLRQTA